MSFSICPRSSSIGGHIWLSDRMRLSLAYEGCGTARQLGRLRACRKGERPTNGRCVATEFARYAQMGLSHGLSSRLRTTKALQAATQLAEPFPLSIMPW